MIAANNTSLTVEIRGTFDVAKARNRLRQMADRSQLSTILKARSSAAITALSELILFRSDQENCNFELTMTILEDEMNEGIEFQFMAPFTNNISQKFALAEWQLERSCDEIGISNRGDNDFVVMRLWAKKRK